MSHRLSRRHFLTGALQAGAGAAVLSVAGGLAGTAEALAAAPGAVTHIPGEPPTYQRYVSRPDLRPPGVWITKTAAAVGAGSPPYIFATPSAAPGATYPVGTQPGLMIFDRNGWLVFFRPQTPKDAQPFNFQVQTYNGQPVLTWFQGTLGPGFGTAGQYFLADAAYRTIRTVQGSDGIPPDLHEFLLTPEGTALHTAYEYLPDQKLYNGHAMEVDVATGELVFDWSCYPAVPVAKTFLPGNADYFHINSIDLWPGSARNLLVSSRNTSAVYLIERATGQILWQAGGKGSSFTMEGPGTRYEYQHDARALPDGSGFSIFDDASPPSPERQAWAKALQVDTTAGQVRLAQQMPHTTLPLVVDSQGNNQLLADGSRFVGWGADPYFSQYDPTGTMVLDGRFPNGVESYRTFTGSWTGSPVLRELAFVVRRGATPGSFTAYASWNGATEVAQWRVTAGTSGSTLAERVTAARHGFETAMPFTASGATEFQVTALAAGGGVLGTSGVVQAS